MALPYPMSPVSPFDVITSQAENEKIANIESLADGTGISDNSIPLSKLKNLATNPKAIQAGTGSITFQTENSSGGTATVNFPTAFDNPPLVVATARGSSVYSSVCYIPSVSTTSFSVLGRTASTSNLSGAFNWIAIDPTTLVIS